MAWWQTALVALGSAVVVGVLSWSGSYGLFRAQRNARYREEAARLIGEAMAALRELDPEVFLERMQLDERGAEVMGRKVERWIAARGWARCTAGNAAVNERCRSSQSRRRDSPRPDRCPAHDGGRRGSLIPTARVVGRRLVSARRSFGATDKRLSSPELTDRACGCGCEAGRRTHPRHRPCGWRRRHDGAEPRHRGTRTADDRTSSATGSE